jgi:hypothetical protein
VIARWAPLVLLACACALAGCGGLRVEVVDAQSGRAVPGARVAVSAQGVVLSSATTGGGGGATVDAAAAPAEVVTVSAAGYAPWGAPVAQPPPASLRVELTPGWVDAFLGDSHAVGADGPAGAMVVPKRCPCDPPAR